MDRGVNMKALILCVMRLVLWKGQGQLERDGKEGRRQTWWGGGKNEEVTFAENEVKIEGGTLPRRGEDKKKRKKEREVR